MGGGGFLGGPLGTKHQLVDGIDSLTAASPESLSVMGYDIGVAREEMMIHAFSSASISLA